ncbi:hypothetical protein [Ewingella americana]|uniref:Uncharacterized protein n=1 Tax=Ewingella americana TaxID=41202 RepID=A0A502GDQ5_9GAMM|nr:hypothetical protein [Ewingella americana]TPG59881.1 hypothetical protein EAH77_15050 [Ewingella americana]
MMQIEMYGQLNDKVAGLDTLFDSLSNAAVLEALVGMVILLDNKQAKLNNAELAAFGKYLDEKLDGIYNRQESLRDYSAFGVLNQYVFNLLEKRAKEFLGAVAKDAPTAILFSNSTDRMLDDIYTEFNVSNLTLDQIANEYSHKPLKEIMDTLVVVFRLLTTLEGESFQYLRTARNALIIAKLFVGGNKQKSLVDILQRNRKEYPLLVEETPDANLIVWFEHFNSLSPDPASIAKFSNLGVLVDLRLFKSFIESEDVQALKSEDIRVDFLIEIAKNINYYRLDFDNNDY